MKVWLNDALVEESEAKVSIWDHGFLYGDGIYETLQVRRLRPLFLKEHLNRLQLSCACIHLDLPWPMATLESCIHQTIVANALERASLRVQISRGVGPIGFDIRGCKAPTLVITEQPLVQYPSSYYEKGVAAVIVETRRNHPRCLPPQAKSTNRLNGILAKWEANRYGVFEGILLNLDGFLTEGTISNVFLVRAGVVLTPAFTSGLLAGVTRKIVMGLAGKAKLTVEEKEIQSLEILRCEEMFLTSSLCGVMPVTELKGDFPGCIGNGQVGPVTRSLMESYEQCLQEQ